MTNRENSAKSLAVNRDLAVGQVIERGMIEIKGPGNGLQPNRLDEIVGKTIGQDLKKGNILLPDDLDRRLSKPKNYNFRRPFGILVRYHNFEKFAAGSNIDFVEFHLGGKDLEVRPSEHLQGQYDIGFVVHVPELFPGDHILDLVSEVEAYQEHSLKEMQRVIGIARELKAQLFTDSEADDCDQYRRIFGPRLPAGLQACRLFGAAGNQPGRPRQRRR